MKGGAVDFRALNERGLVQVIGRRVRLKKSGREYTGLCPFHDDRTPSFSVVPSKGFYHCFGCGAPGSAIDFVMKTERVDFPEAVRRILGDAPPPEQLYDLERARRRKDRDDKRTLKKQAIAIKLWKAAGAISGSIWTAISSPSRVRG